MDNEIRMLHTAVLRHDVPVDRGHVEALKRSIRARGQVAPVLVRIGGTGGAEIIDGFHRVTALAELAGEGLTPYAETLVMTTSCDSEAFQDARIIAASMHKGVSFARITLWVRELFLTTRWAGKMHAAEAFRLGGKQGQAVSYSEWDKRYHNGAQPMGGDELWEIAKWVKAKSHVWGLSPDQIANMLALADIASPSLVPMVTERRSRHEQVLTRPMLRNIAQRIPDHQLQEAVAAKAIAEGLNEVETLQLVGEVVTIEPERRSEVLTTRWLDREKPQSAPAPVLKPGATIVGLCVATARNLASWIDKLSEMGIKADSEVSTALADVVAAVLAYQGQGPSASKFLRAEIARLSAEGRDLRSEVKRLSVQLQRYERISNTARKIYTEDTQ